MVGYGKVVVYSLGNAYKLYGAFYLFRIVAQPHNSVHTVVAAYVEKCVNVKLFKYRKYFIVSFFVSLYVGQFITATSQK